MNFTTVAEGLKPTDLLSVRRLPGKPTFDSATVEPSGTRGDQHFFSPFFRRPGKTH